MPAPPRTPAPRAVVLALVALTFTTGVIDAVCYLGLGRVFTANMTGNVVLLGFGLTGTDGLPVLAPLVSLAAFAAGAAAAGHALRRRTAVAKGGAIGPAVLGAVLVLEGLLAGGAAVVTASTHVAAGTVLAGVLIALLAVAMGARNAVVRKLGVPDLTTTVLTMTVTGLAADGPTAPRDAHVRRISALTAMLAGAVVGALLVEHTLWVPLALVAAVAAALAWRLLRRPPAEA